MNYIEGLDLHSKEKTIRDAWDFRCLRHKVALAAYEVCKKNQIRDWFKAKDIAAILDGYQLDHITRALGAHRSLFESRMQTGSTSTRQYRVRQDLQVDWGQL